MTEKMTQEQRLDTLVEAFKADSVQYKDMQTPADTEGKRRILRSLMNIRMPKICVFYGKKHALINSLERTRIWLHTRHPSGAIEPC